MPEKAVRTSRERQDGPDTPRVTRAVTSPQSPHPVHALQRRAGNRAVVAALGGPLQAKLTVGAAHDPYEAEADAVAGEVLRTLDAGVSPLGAPSASLHANEEEGGPHIHRIAAADAEVGLDGGTVSESVESRIRGARGHGQTLPRDTRAAMEGAFGAGFDGVRLHRGPEAEALNRSVGATAFTLGSDIFLGSDAPSLTSPAGKHLLAHELTHTIQQGGRR
jgi:hypothetical protein